MIGRYCNCPTCTAYRRALDALGHKGDPLMGQPLIDRDLAEFDADGRQIVFPISPFGASETREERIARLVDLGTVALDCAYCVEALAHPTLSAFAPRHDASPRCRSGRRPHCTCDTCF